MKIPLLSALAMVLVALPRHAAMAQDAPGPAFLNGVGIQQRLGESIPLDLPFRDEDGKTVALKELFHQRPVLLTLVYYQCPMLCTITLNQLVRSLNALQESAGERFDVIAISFDPRETAELAASKKASYLKEYARPSAAAGWHFLTGEQEAISRLTRAVGFNYHWDDQTQSYVHASTVMVLTPDGTISRYFLGVDYPPTELEQAIADASGGSIGRAAEPIFLYCFRYDPSTGKYGLIISRAIQVMGIATFLALAGLIAGNVLRERRRSRRDGAEGRS